MDSLGFLLWHATLRWQRSIALALGPLGITHVQFVLLISTWWFTRQGHHPNQRELADHAGTNIMMTSQVVRSLEAKGLLERPTDADDTRARRLGVTRAGEALASRALQAVEDADREYFRLVADQEHLLTTLRTMAGRSLSGAVISDGLTTSVVSDRGPRVARVTARTRRTRRVSI